MSKNLKRLYYEPAGSKETPEELNDRLQHVLQGMSAKRDDVTRQCNYRINPAGEKMLEVPKETAQSKTIEQRNARLKRASNLRSIKSNDSTYRNNQIERNLKKISEFRINETTKERDARLAEALNQVSEVKLVKEQNARPIFTKVHEKTSEGVNEEPKNTAQMAELPDCGIKCKDIPEEDKIQSETAFHTLLSFFLKQEHKPPSPQVEPSKRQAELTKIAKSRKTTIAVDADSQVKTENVFDGEFHIDMEDTVQKMNLWFNADTYRDNVGLKEVNQHEFNEKAYTLNNVEHEDVLEDSLLSKNFEEIKELENFDTCLLPSQPNLEIFGGNMNTTKEEVDMDAEHT